MDEPIARRLFLGRAAAVCLGYVAPTLGPRRSVVGAAPDVTLRVALLTTGSDARARHDGALLGVEEARHAATLFGGTVILRASESAEAAADADVAAVIGDDDEARCRAILARRGSTALLMNVMCTSDALRGTSCNQRAFHIAPSAAMLARARAAVRGATEIIAWDRSLSRFGADTLNERFLRRFGTPMTPAAWSAWFAVKVLWESSLRMKSGDAARIAEYLARDTTRFDGHKGQPLSFRAGDHQLRQPLYARTASGLLDVPGAGLMGEPANGVPPCGV